MLHRISVLERNNSKGGKEVATSSVGAVPWLDLGYPKLNLSSPPSPCHPYPRTKGMHEGLQ